MCPCTVWLTSGLFLCADPVMAPAWFFWSPWGIVDGHMELLVNGFWSFMLNLLWSWLALKKSFERQSLWHWWIGNVLIWRNTREGLLLTRLCCRLWGSAVVVGLLLGRSLFREISCDQGPGQDSHSLCSGLSGLGSSCAFCFVLAEWP